MKPIETILPERPCDLWKKPNQVTGVTTTKGLTKGHFCCEEDLEKRDEESIPSIRITIGRHER